MAPFTCPYIKRDDTICGNKCWLPEGCYRHWKLYEKNLKKNPVFLVVVNFPLMLIRGIATTILPVFIRTIIE